MPLKRTTLTLDPWVLDYFRGIGGGSASKGMRIVASGSSEDTHKVGRPRKQATPSLENNAYETGDSKEGD